MPGQAECMLFVSRVGCSMPGGGRLVKLSAWLFVSRVGCSLQRMDLQPGQAECMLFVTKVGCSYACGGIRPQSRMIFSIL